MEGRNFVECNSKKKEIRYEIIKRGLRANESNKSELKYGSGAAYCNFLGTVAT